MGLTACKSDKVYVDAYNDMEIYVSANCTPFYYHTRGKPDRTDTPDFPFYNTLTLFPKHNTYSFQTSKNLVAHNNSMPYDPTFISGRYIKRNDTIICIPDVVYKENPEYRKDEKKIVSDTANLQFAPDFRPRYFLKKSKYEIADITPDYTGLFDYELDAINAATGYVWTLRDFEFMGLNPEQRTRLKILGDCKRAKVISKYEEQKEIYTIYYRVPYKVKSKIANGRVGYNTHTKFYAPVKQ